MACTLDSCDVGKMRQRIEFKRLVLVSDEIGGSTSTYETYHVTWSEIKPASSSQVWQAQQLSLRVSHSIKCRFFTGIKISDRIEYNGRSFEVQEIINVEERDRFYQIVANEGDAS